MAQRTGTAVDKAPWWKGARGEWLVAAQLALMALIFFGPRSFSGRPAWALLVQGWLTLGYAALLFVFLDFKSRREEQWLAEKFPAYGDYQRRVRKLIPFVY